MSSTANPYGMIPVENQGAQYNTQGFEQVPILDGYTTSIFFGDVVKLGSNNTLEKDTGTTSLTPYGVFLGCKFISPSLGYFQPQGFWPASTTTGYTTYPNFPMGYVSTFPWGVFQIQANGPVTWADIGKNAAIVQTAGTSVPSARAATLSTSATLDTTRHARPLRVVGLVDIPDQCVGRCLHRLVLVKFNNTQQITHEDLACKRSTETWPQFLVLSSFVSFFRASIPSSAWKYNRYENEYAEIYTE
jgi:hypothetical protein